MCSHFDVLFNMCVALMTHFCGVFLCWCCFDSRLQGQDVNLIIWGFFTLISYLSVLS